MPLLLAGAHRQRRQRKMQSPWQHLESSRCQQRARRWPASILEGDLLRRQQRAAWRQRAWRLRRRHAVLPSTGPSRLHHHLSRLAAVLLERLRARHQQVSKQVALWH